MPDYTLPQIRVFLAAVGREQSRALRNQFAVTRTAVNGDKGQCEKLLRALDC